MEQLGLTILDYRGVAMNLQADWGYILEVAERRLRNNRTHRHIISEKGRLEIIERRLGIMTETLARLIEGRMGAGGMSLRQAGREIGIAHTTLKRILDGEPYDVATAPRNPIVIFLAIVYNHPRSVPSDYSEA
ncbi:MAG TPA: helix-turn-helix domain-containing protein [Anaerolineales bacterium]